MAAMNTIMRVITDMVITMAITRRIAMDTMKVMAMVMGTMRLTVTDIVRVIVTAITRSITMATAKITAMDMIKPCYILTEKSLCRDLYILAEKADHATHLVQTSLCRQNSTCWHHIREAIYKLEYGLDLFDKYVDHTTLDKCFTRSEEVVVTKCYLHYAQSLIRLLTVTHESGRYLEGEVDRPILTAINSLRAADRAFVLDLGRRIECKESLKVIMRKQGAEDGSTGDSVQEAFNRFIFTPLITGEDFKNHPSEAEERARKVKHHGKEGPRKHHMAPMGATQRLFLMFERTRMAIVMFTSTAIIMATREVITTDMKGVIRRVITTAIIMDTSMAITTAIRRVTMSFTATRMSMVTGITTVMATTMITKATIMTLPGLPLLLTGDKSRPLRPLAISPSKNPTYKHRYHDKDDVELWTGSEPRTTPHGNDRATMRDLRPMYKHRGGDGQYAVDKLRADRGGYGLRDDDGHYDDDRHHGKFDRDDDTDYFFDELEEEDDDDEGSHPKSEHNGRLHDEDRRHRGPYHHAENQKYVDRKYQ
ncbi:hypothetical protein N0V84_001542 [Fusarium piperis]|uniref:Uncharacterized protein n=1 Tax=Fusarium piperis TaxID=1435070 RepID=A0A9W8WL03_9HYPO|nr:hypothetical protein N0V84_001542 [Fusarium piperis]